MGVCAKKKKEPQIISRGKCFGQEYVINPEKQWFHDIVANGYSLGCILRFLDAFWSQDPVENGHYV